MTLPSEVASPAPTVELAFNPDLSLHPAAWTWTDASDDLLEQSIKVRKGRSDEIGIVSPSSTMFELDNQSGVWTPDDARSPHWPDLTQGTPARVTIDGGPHRLYLDGTSDVSTPDTAGTSITGDIDVRGELDITWFDNPLSWGNEELVTKWESTGNQRSYRLLQLVRQVTFQWSPDGTSAASLFFGAVSPMMTHGAVRATLDVNNGSGGWTGRLYWAPTLDGPWVQFQETTGVGTTSIFNSTASLRVGRTTIGYGRRFAVYAGLAGTDLRAAPDFTGRPLGAAAFVDAAGLTWTFNGTAAVVDSDVRCFGQLGEISPTWPYGDISGPNTTTQPGESRVDIAVAGILRRLSQGQKAVRSTLYRMTMGEAKVPSVLAYWPLEDGHAATRAGSPIPGVRPGLVSVPFAADDTHPGSDALPSQSGGQGFGWDLPVPATVPTTNWQVTWQVKVPTPETAPAFTDLMRVDVTAGTISQWVVRLDATNISVFAKDLDGVNISPTNPATTSTPAAMVDVWNTVQLSVTQSGSDVAWRVDIMPNGSDTLYGTSGTLTTRTAGRPARLRTLGTAPPDGISVGHVVVSTDLVAGWPLGADSGWAGETAGRRLYRLCDEENIQLEIIGDELASQTFRGDPTKTTVMGPQGLKTVVDLLTECADVDMGILGEQKERLGLSYRTRQSLYNQTPALDLDAAFGNVGDITHPFEPTLDDQSLRNEVTASRDSGSSVTVTTDPAPQAGRRYEESVTVNVDTDEQLVDQAGWRLHLGSWPGMRYRSVSSELTVAPHQMDPWRAVRLGDRLTVSNLPPQHPAPDVDLLIQGWTETLSPTRWTVEANCTPAGPWDVGVLDDDTPTTSLARIDTDGSVTAGTLTETQTGALSVTVTGALWTTSASYFPMNVLIGGEEVTLSGISGGSSPQTFTISARSVNGVRKSHSTGEAVTVANPFRLAM